MFGLGIPEILFIVLLAILILGPEQMPRAAKLIGQWSAKIRSAATSLNTAVKEDQELRELHDNIQAVRSDLSSVKNELLAPVRETEQVIQTGRSELMAIKQDVSSSLSLHPDAPKEDKTNSKDDSASTDILQKESPFLSKPLSWFKTEENTTSETSPSDKPLKLPKPKLLPGNISRQVSRMKIELTPAKVVSMDSVQSHPQTLTKPCPGRASLRRYSLIKAHPRFEANNKITLKIPQKCILKHRSIDLPEVR